jgi:cation transport protein ChaC
MKQGRSLYVFGYGSLMWRPDFPYVWCRPALALGHSRKLCVWSSTYRGSPERPGLVFGLDITPGRAAPGMLFKVDGRDRRKVIHYLFQRELIYPIYQPSRVIVEVENKTVPALTFTVDRDDPAYATDISRIVRRAAIASGAGRAGRAKDYLANALLKLRELGVHEPELEADLIAAEDLPDDPQLLFSLINQAMRCRLNLVFKPAHERPPV